MPIIESAVHRLSPERIEAAAAVIDPLFLDSPQFECEPLSQALECHLTLKIETMNPLRSFKGRGACFFVHEAASASGPCRLVCATAGNFGQAMAWACRANARPLVVFTTTRASPHSVARMRAMGADVRQESEDFEVAKQAARRFAAEQGAWFVEDGHEPAIAEGAGTIGRELLRRGGRFDSVVLPVGDGALVTGVGRWIKSVAPATRVIGVCSEGADAMAASWRAGRVITRASANTIAQCIAVRHPVPQALADMAGTVDDIVQVSDRSITEAMRLLQHAAALVAEPSGAAGLAALLQHPSLREGRIATVITGSNVTPG